MKVLYLVPTRGLADPNTARERLALERLGENEVRVLAPPSGGSGGMLRRLGDVFALARAAARESPADIVVCRDLDTLRAGVRTKAAFGPPTKLVYWPHDVYEWMVEADVPPLVPNVLTRHERRLLPFIDALVASNVGVLNWTLTQRGSLPIPPVALVMPCRDPLHHDPPPESRTLCYLGTLHRNRFSVELLRAMRRIDGRLILAAPRTNELYGWVGANLPPNVEFRGTLGEAGVIAATRESDLVVSMLNPADRNLRIGLANKVFDAMSVGRAAVGTVGTATGDLIAVTEMGALCRYDEDDFVGTVSLLLDSPQTLREMSANAHRACVERYNWTTETRKLWGLLDALG